MPPSGVLFNCYNDLNNKTVGERGLLNEFHEEIEFNVAVTVLFKSYCPSESRLG